MKYYWIGVLLFSCLVISYARANDQKILSINKNNVVLLDFSKSSFDETKIQFSLEDISDAKIIVLDHKAMLHITSYDTYETWKIKITYGTKVTEIPVIIEYQKNVRHFDIFEDMLHLRLQKKTLSCEAAAAATIFSQLLEKDISEEVVIQKLPKSMADRTSVKIGKDTFWGNPNAWFVGYSDYFWEPKQKPSQKKKTGYGVYEKPIAIVGDSLWLKTKIHNIYSYTESSTPEKHLTFLLESLQQWKMVELWGDWCTLWKNEDGTIEKINITQEKALKKISAKNECYDVEQPRKLEWKYLDEHKKVQTFTGLAGEHAFVLLGWIGNIQKPDTIIVWDTDTGYHQYSTKEWLRKWSKMQYRSLIVETK
jgi:hypothetical protein